MLDVVSDSLLESNVGEDDFKTELSCFSCFTLIAKSKSELESSLNKFLFPLTSGYSPSSELITMYSFLALFSWLVESGCCKN